MCSSPVAMVASIMKSTANRDENAYLINNKLNNTFFFLLVHTENLQKVLLKCNQPQTGHPVKSKG